MDGPVGVTFEAQLLYAALTTARNMSPEQGKKSPHTPPLSSDMRVNGVDGLEVRVERCHSVIGAKSQIVDVLVVSDAGYVSRLIIPPQQPGERILGLYPETEAEGRRSVGFFGPLAGVVSVVFALNTGNGKYTPMRNAYYDLRTGKAVDGTEMFASLRQA